MEVAGPDTDSRSPRETNPTVNLFLPEQLKYLASGWQRHIAVVEEDRVGAVDLEWSGELECKAAHGEPE